MRAFQRIAGQAVIIMILALRPVHELKLASIVLRVATRARGSFHVGRTVVSSAGVDPRLQCGVTCEALGTRQLLA